MLSPSTWNDRSELLGGVAKLGFVTAELLFVGFLIRVLDLESTVFSRQLWSLMVGAFVVHHLLPARVRAEFFLAVSVFALGFVFRFPDAGWILGVGLLFFAICHLPLRMAGRAALLTVATLGLAAMRVGLWPAPWSSSVWPILASMLMFRTIVYLLGTADPKLPMRYATALSYFFVFPNVAFPLFPIVDYATYCRRWYDRDAFAIYQRGIELILRGVVHLVVYRFVTHYVVTGPEEVIDPQSLVLHLVGNFALVVRVSGQFHLIVGVLHLFGFRLPRIMNLYFLATSFTDFWRRVNVYWKDFLQKLVFYPVFLRTRSWSEPRRLALATILAFVATWFLHSYQWFWIQGRFLVSKMDVAFWSALGAVMLVNTLVDSRRGPAKALGGPAWSGRELASRGLRSMVTFLAVATLWSLWVSDSFADWMSLWKAARLDAGSVAILLAGGTFFFVAATALFTPRWIADDEVPQTGTQGGRFALRALAPAAVLLAIGVLPKGRDLGAAGEVLMNLRISRIGARDQELLTRGYYEDLTDVARFSPELWSLYLKRPPEWTPGEMYVPVDGVRGFALTPSLTTVVKGAPFRTNRWGMRDREYAREKPAGTYRIALLGGSPTLGSGVGNAETYENRAEDLLNTSTLPQGIRRVEILNFAVAGYSAPQQLALVESEVFAFQPDAVLYAAHSGDRSRTADVIHLWLRTGRDLQYPYLREMIAKAGVTPTMGTAEARRRLKPRMDRLLSWSYEGIVAASRAHGAVPMMMFVPMPNERRLPQNHLRWRAAVTLEKGRAAGFHTLDLADAYRGESARAIRIADWDDHPNARAHRLLGSRLVAELVGERGLFGHSADRRNAKTEAGPLEDVH